MKKERDHRVSYDILGRSPVASLVATFVGSGLSSYPHLRLLKLGVCAIECGTGVTSPKKVKISFLSRQLGFF
jgi:hypothetical protein